VCLISTATKPQLTLVEALADDDNQEDKINKEEHEEVKDRLLRTWIDIMTMTLLSVTCNFCCTFHIGADQGVTMVQKMRLVNLVPQGFVVLAQERWEVCWSLHQMVVLCADGAAASEYYG